MTRVKNASLIVSSFFLVAAMGVACHKQSASQAESARAPEASPVPAASTRGKKPVRKKPWSERMGFVFEPHANTPVATIAALKPAAYAEVVGLKVGDTIRALNDQPVKDALEFEHVANTQARLRPKPWVFTVSRAGQEDLKITHLPEYRCNPFTLVLCGALVQKEAPNGTGKPAPAIP